MKKYTLEELLAVEISKIIRDDEMNFTGIGTGGKAYIRACGIPLVAVSLAQMKHAPNAVCMIRCWTKTLFRRIIGSMT